MSNISLEVILRVFCMKIPVIMDVHLYINPIIWSGSWFCIDWSFPKWRNAKNRYAGHEGK